MFDYGIIYFLRCPFNKDLIYFGWCFKSKIQKLSEFKKEYKKYLNNECEYKEYFRILQSGMTEIIHIQRFKDVDNIEEYTNVFIKKFKCLNKNSGKENFNMKKIKKLCRKNNSSYRREKIQCKCGHVLSKNCMFSHLKGKKHRLNMKNVL